MRNEGKEETTKVRRERCQFSRKLITGNTRGKPKIKNLVRLLV